MTSESIWEKRYLREKNARQQAEQLLEAKSLELYDANLALKEAWDDLQNQVTERTRKYQQAVVVLKKEVAKRKAAENDLRIARDNAVETSDMKSKFLASMSHEIRTPLNAIIGFSGLLLDSELNTKQREQMLHVKSSSILLLRLINDILDLSKIEADKLDLEYAPTDIRTIVRQSIALLMPEAARKGLKFKFSKPKTLVNRVVVDSGRIQQVLLNFLSNAVRYSDRGYVHVSLNVELANADKLPLPSQLSDAMQTGSNSIGFINVSVKDNGVGIRKEDMDKLFTQFTQFSGSGTGTTGLGLAICKRITTLMGGEIKVQSEYGEGSTFTFRIPCGISLEHESTTNTKSENDLETDTLKSFDETGVWLTDDKDFQSVNTTENMAHDKPLSILLADDYKVNRMVQQAQIEQLGYKADAVANGEEVLRALHSRPYDVILMDVRMPIMDGVECTERIRRNSTSHQPFIVAVTASALAGDQKTFTEAGMDAYISKPVTLDKLSSVLDDAFEHTNNSTCNTTPHSSETMSTTSLDLSELYTSLGPAADKLLLSVIPVYLRELPAREASLRNAFTDGNAEALAQVCHGLKGSCSIMGATSLANKFGEVEELAYEGELPTISRIDSLLELSREAAHALRQELDALNQRAEKEPVSS